MTLALPFIGANAIVRQRLERFFSLIRPGQHTASREYVVLTVTLFLMLAGARIAARPLWRPGPAEDFGIRIVNATCATVLFVTFTLIALGLGAEVCRCDVMAIANCD